MISRLKIRCALAAMVLLGGAVGMAQATTVASGFDASTLAANDDGSTSLVNLPFTINFYGTDYSSLYVNNNGT